MNHTTTWAVLLLLAGPLAGPAAETLVLTVTNDSGAPGEPRTVWTQDYYADETGRLTRIHERRQAAFNGEADRHTDWTLTWTADGVTWTWPEGPRSVVFEFRRSGSGLTLTETSSGSKGGTLDYRLKRLIRLLGAEGRAWSDPDSTTTWDPQAGLTRTPNSPPADSRRLTLGYRTSGDRLERLRAGRLDSYLVLARGPASRLVATFYDSGEQEGTWVKTGTLTLSGPGFPPSPDWVRVAQALILERLIGEPVAAPFVLGARGPARASQP